MSDAERMNALTVQWTPRLDGEHAYVVEKIIPGESGTTEWGPMPPAIVQVFIAERRASVEKQFSTLRDGLMSRIGVAGAR